MVRSRALRSRADRRRCRASSPSTRTTAPAAAMTLRSWTSPCRCRFRPPTQIWHHRSAALSPLQRSDATASGNWRCSPRSTSTAAKPTSLAATATSGFSTRASRVSEQTGEDVYRDNDLDRGHLVRRLDPAWGPKSAAAVDDTFHFTNCAPQHHEFNAGRTLWLGPRGLRVAERGDGRPQGQRAVRTGARR